MDYVSFIFLVVSPANAGLLIILNVIEILFIWKMQLIKKSKSIIFLVNLSLADIFLGLIICTSKVTDSYSLHPIMSEISSFLKESLIQVSLLVSILTNLVLTSERLLLVKLPLRYKQITRRHRVWICLGMWITVALVTLGFYFTEYTFKKQFVIVSSMVFVSLPWPIICFVLIKRNIRNGLSKQYQVKKTTNNNNDNSPQNANERKFLSLCQRTFAVFTVCWTPYSVYGYLVFFGIVGDDPVSVYWTAIQYTVHVIAFINSTLNPVIYLFTYNFLHKFSCKSKDGQRTTTSSSEHIPTSTIKESICMEQNNTTQ